MKPRSGAAVHLVFRSSSVLTLHGSQGYLTFSDLSNLLSIVPVCDQPLSR